MNEIRAIEKELIEQIHFPAQEVLSSPEKVNNRLALAQKARLLGNSHKGKVKIVFEDTEGRKVVETTIWGVTDKYLLLKRGMSLPLHRVLDIIL
jgi:hypothetical protein